MIVASHDLVQEDLLPRPHLKLECVDGVGYAAAKYKKGSTQHLLSLLCHNCWIFWGFHVGAQTGVLDCIIHFLSWSLGYEARVKEEQEYHEKTRLMSNSLHEKMRQSKSLFFFVVYM
jgi:hypothetical protein